MRDIINLPRARRNELPTNSWESAVPPIRRLRSSAALFGYTTPIVLRAARRLR